MIASPGPPLCWSSRSPTSVGHRARDYSKAHDLPGIKENLITGRESATLAACYFCLYFSLIASPSRLTFTVLRAALISSGYTLSPSIMPQALFTPRPLGIIF